MHQSVETFFLTTERINITVPMNMRYQIYHKLLSWFSNVLNNVSFYIGPNYIYSLYCQIYFSLLIAFDIKLTTRSFIFNILNILKHKFNFSCQKNFDIYLCYCELFLISFNFSGFYFEKYHYAIVLPSFYSSNRSLQLFNR